MKRSIVFLPFLALLMLSFTCFARETEENASYLPQSTRESLIKEFSNHPDIKNYPNFVNHLIRMINHKRHRLDINEHVAKHLGGNGRWAIQSSFEDLKDYFQACSDDRLTMLRTMAMIGTLVRKTNTLIYMDGRDVNKALAELNLAPGLALPVAHLKLFAYIPNPRRAQEDPLYQCNVLAIYDEMYKHRFRDEVLNANLKIGTGEQAPFVDVFSDDKTVRDAYLVKGILTYGDTHVGFMEVSGIGGEKRGFMGFLQKILFFLPDAIDAMTLDKEGNMTTIALINETVNGFEHQRKYQVHRIGELPWEEEPPT